MIRTVVGGKMSFDRIAEELVNQHPRIHEKATFGCGQFRRNDYNGHQRPGIPKGRDNGYQHRESPATMPRSVLRRTRC